MRTTWSVNEEGVALGGYDVVAYLETNEPTRGRADHAVEHEGATFWFASAEHARLFRQSPSRYLPAFGGFCAFAVAAKGAKVPADPRTFKLRDGELLLFYNGFHEGQPLNTAIPWNQDEAAMHAAARANWGAMTSG